VACSVQTHTRTTPLLPEAHPTPTPTLTLQSVAQYHALEDAMYHMQKGLERGAISLATFLKVVGSITLQQSAVAGSATL
jgi:VPS23-like protein